MSQEEEIQTFGILLRDIRETAGMSRLELAARVGCKYDDIRLYEKGKRIMRIDRLFRILDVLGVCLSENFPDIRVYKASVRMAALDSESRRILLDRIYAMIEETEIRQEESVTENEKTDLCPTNTL